MSCTRVLFRIIAIPIVRLHLFCTAISGTILKKVFANTERVARVAVASSRAIGGHRRLRAPNEAALVARPKHDGRSLGVGLHAA